MDYGKYKYEQEQKAKTARKHQSQIQVKEIKLRPKIGVHDYETKKGHVVRFLGNRAKVKVTIMFRGREQTHPERGRDLLHAARGGREGARDDRVAAAPGRTQHGHGARASQERRTRGRSSPKCLSRRQSQQRRSGSRSPVRAAFCGAMPCKSHNLEKKSAKRGRDFRNDQAVDESDVREVKRLLGR